MAGRPNARVPKAAIDRRRAVIAAAIAALGPPLPGSLVERRTALRPNPDNARRLRELTSELESLTLQQLRADPAQPDP